MKFPLASLFLLLLFFACVRQDKTQTNATQELKRTIKSDRDILKKRKACEVLSIEKIAQVMMVEVSEIQRKDLSLGSSRSVCYYYSKEGNRKLFIRMVWKNDRAITDSLLSKRYKRYLAVGDTLVGKYREVYATDNIQILFAIDQGRENNYIHLLRKRYGNHAEIQIELTKKYKDTGMEEVLMEMLKKIEEGELTIGLIKY